VRSFGNYHRDTSGNPLGYLAYAVEGFFLNGGLRCYIARVASSTATPAKASSGPFTIRAAGPGASGSNIAYWMRTASTSPKDTTTFRLSLYYWTSATDAKNAIANIAGNNNTLVPTPTQTEDFDNLSTSPASSTYFVQDINDSSKLVTMAPTEASGTNIAYGNAPTLLAGGTDGGALVLADFEGSTVDPANVAGLAALGAVDEISLLCCPDEGTVGTATTSPVAVLLQTQCETLKDRFAILQASTNPGKAANVRPTVNSQRGYSAFYYPWLRIINPTTGCAALIPPGGHIAGIYVRCDNAKNVAKNPANEVIMGINSLQVLIDDQTQAILNPLGVNCLRYFKGQGNFVWGARTTSPDPDWEYISVRRLLIYVETSIQEGMQWVVFEPNDQATWSRVIRSVSDFLTGLWMQGMLHGATREQAFFVRCDTTTMTQADLDNGRLIAIVGIAPVKPAEFVIFRIGQWAGGSSLTES
jgi:phage tail sheath protein FI